MGSGAVEKDGEKWQMDGVVLLQCICMGGTDYSNSSSLAVATEITLYSKSLNFSFSPRAIASCILFPFLEKLGSRLKNTLAA